ncbi:MAG: hypothetical protein ACHREM_00975 [Polyangiales bacterium]
MTTTTIEASVAESTTSALDAKCDALPDDRRIYFLAQDYFVARERLKLAVRRTRIPRDSGAPRASKSKVAIASREAHAALLRAVSKLYLEAGGDAAFGKLAPEWQRSVRKHVRAVLRTDATYSSRGCLCEVHNPASRFHVHASEVAS